MLACPCCPDSLSRPDFSKEPMSLGVHGHGDPWFRRSPPDDQPERTCRYGSLRRSRCKPPRPSETPWSFDPPAFLKEAGSGRGPLRRIWTSTRHETPVAVKGMLGIGIHGPHSRTLCGGWRRSRFGPDGGAYSTGARSRVRRRRPYRRRRDQRDRHRRLPRSPGSGLGSRVACPGVSERGCPRRWRHRSHG